MSEKARTNRGRRPKPSAADEIAAGRMEYETQPALYGRIDLPVAEESAPGPAPAKRRKAPVPPKPRKTEKPESTKAARQKRKKAAEPIVETYNTPARSRRAPSKSSAQSPAQVAASTGSKRRVQQHPTIAPGTPPVKIVFLGGINEIGKNLTAYECGNDILVVDCGTSFPDDDMLGVDLVIPDYTYLEKNQDRVRGILITHGHEDHIGGLPYLLQKINCPVYATRLTIGLIANKLSEHGMIGQVKLQVVEPRETLRLGCMSVEFIRVNHSIPDAVAMAINTPAGVIIQTGDFKIDYTPISGGVIDIARLGELGGQGVLALLADSTNAERPGSTRSERSVGESFVNLFHRAGDRRIIIATFSSNIHRIQQVLDLAVQMGRKVCISGRSMINVTTTAMELGYLHVPEGLLVDIDEIHRYPNEEMIVVTTGSQGEPMSALYRMAMNDHRKLSIGEDDFIIISATPIPGNEKLVSRVVNELMKQGAEVIYESMYEVHVSGHACRDELRMMHGLVRPKYFIPVHGEYKHLRKHAQIALEMGMDPANILFPDIGRVITFSEKGVNCNESVPAGRVLVDGLGVGDVGSIVLRDRKHLAEDGLIMVAVAVDGQTGNLVSGPEITSRGFVYVREAEELMEEATEVVRSALLECQSRRVRDFGSIKSYVRDSLSSFLYQKTKRNPMILTTILPT